MTPWPFPKEESKGKTSGDDHLALPKGKSKGRASSDQPQVISKGKGKQGVDPLVLPKEG